MKMRIYVANLAAYNSGYLVGEWIDLPLDEDELQEKIDEVLNAWNDGFGPSEEYAIHDYELPFDIEEYDSPFIINKYVYRIKKLEVRAEDIKPIFDYFGDIEAVLDILESGNFIFYQCDNMAEVAEEFFEENYNFDDLPSEVKYNIDWEAIGETMEKNGTFIEVENGFVEIID